MAPLNVLCEYCIPLIKMKGIFFAMKGPAVQEELNGSSYAIELLGGEETVLPFLLPDGEERTLIKIQKKRFTPKAVSYTHLIKRVLFQIFLQAGHGCFFPEKTYNLLCFWKLE